MKSLKIVQNSCDHFVVVNISKVVGFDAFIILCYIPPTYSDYICNNCDNNYMEALSDLVARYSLKGSVSICGDLNGRIGELSDEPIVSQFDATVGQFSYIGSDSPVWHTKLCDRASMDKTSNPRGDEVLHLCKSTGLRVMNGRCFDDKDIGKFTFTSGIKRSVNDYLLCDEKMYNSLTMFSIGEKWAESDHCPVYFGFNVENQTTTPISHDEPVFDKYSRFFWENDSKDEFMSCLYDNRGEKQLDDFYQSIYQLDSVDIVSDKYSSYPSGHGPDFSTIIPP